MLIMYGRAGFISLLVVATFADGRSLASAVQPARGDGCILSVLPLPLLEYDGWERWYVGTGIALKPVYCISQTFRRDIWGIDD